MKNLFKTFFCVLFISICANAFAQTNFLYDTAELLQDSEKKSINDELETISNQHNFGVYIITIDDFLEYTTDIESASEVIYKDLNLGLNDDKSGILFLISMADRSYDLYVSGSGNEFFPKKKRSKLEKAFLDDFKENNWKVGIADFIQKVDNYLTCYEDGSLDEDQIALLRSGLIISFIIALIIAYFRMKGEKSKLNNMHFATDANNYTENGIELTRNQDIFKYTTTRTIVHKSNSSSGSSSSSHSSGHF